MSTPDTLTASPLARTVSDTATDIWNDSCNVDELRYAVSFGAVGATANPTIVGLAVAPTAPKATA